MKGIQNQNGKENSRKKKLKWAAFKWKDKDNNVRIRIDKMIELREFINRYGFVSSFAHQINCFVDKHSPTRIQNVQLHYVALLQTSQIQFYYVLGRMIDKEKGTYKGKNVFKEYQEEVKLLKLVLNGGPITRVHLPSLKWYKFLSDETLLTKNLEKLEEALKALENGDFLDNNSNIKYDLSFWKIIGIGPFGLISFPSLVLFTGLCLPTKSAVSTAKQSRVNTTTKNSYFDKMKSFCKEHANGFLINLDNKSYYSTAWRNIAISWGDVCASIENGTCGTFRGLVRYGIFFHGQSQYNLQCDTDKVLV